MLPAVRSVTLAAYSIALRAAAAAAHQRHQHQVLSSSSASSVPATTCKSEEGEDERRICDSLAILDQLLQPLVRDGELLKTQEGGDGVSEAGGCAEIQKILLREVGLAAEEKEEAWLFRLEVDLLSEVFGALVVGTVAMSALQAADVSSDWDPILVPPQSRDNLLCLSYGLLDHYGRMVEDDDIVVRYEEKAMTERSGARPVKRDKKTMRVRLLAHNLGTSTLPSLTDTRSLVSRNLSTIPCRLRTS
ncbi:hypothetical protein CF327_g6365 [Tilletia walkeri]|nr:hypothetical protein CF327_g6365 [Tilletia walkeri]